MIRFAIIPLLFAAVAAQAAPGPEMQQAVGQGKSLFMHETFGGNGKTCNACHSNGGVGQGALPNGKRIPSLENAAAIFPRYNMRMKKIITLEDQIHSCIHGGLQGTPPEYGSEKLVELVSYVTSLAQGKPLDMDGKPH